MKTSFTKAVVDLAIKEWENKQRNFRLVFVTPMMVKISYVRGELEEVKLTNKTAKIEEI